MIFKAFLFFVIIVVTQPILASNHALLIGIDDYQGSGFSSLTGALNDARLMHDVLNNSRFGFLDENILLLTNEQASHNGLKAAFHGLANRVNQGDFVYIHYSGYGSRTTDLNGDEADGQDLTWVSHGARQNRAAESSELNSYDVLDDELNSWLAPIYKKAGEVVIISDTSHLAFAPRGVDAWLNRSVPMDMQFHPRGTTKYPDFDNSKSLLIDAAGVHDAVTEFVADDGRNYGVFSWYWARAIRDSQEGDTWKDILKKTSSLMKVAVGASQKPIMNGDGDAEIFSGHNKQIGNIVRVIELDEQLNRVKLNVGRLSGASVGSVYGRSKDSQPDHSVRVTLRNLGDYVSYGSLEGTLRTGELLNEISHAYHIEPLKVFINGDFPSSVDSILLKEVAKLVEDLPGYIITKTQSESDLVLYLLRPDRKNGLGRHRAIDAKGLTATLPPSFKDLPAEVWVLTPGEQPLYSQLYFSNIDTGKQDKYDELSSYLVRLVGNRKIGGLESQNIPDIQVSALRYKQDENCREESSQCLELDGGELYKRESLQFLSLSEIAQRDFQVGDLLQFSVVNTAEEERYLYILSVSEEGSVEMIFPHPEDADDADEMARLAPGSQEVVLDSMLKLSNAGLETLTIISSQKPISFGLLETDIKLNNTATVSVDNQLQSTINFNSSDNYPKVVMLENRGWGASKFTFSVLENTLNNKDDYIVTRGFIGDGYIERKEKFVQVKVHFGTNRASGSVNDKGVATFTNQRGELVLGKLLVTIPPNHQPGHLESPEVLSFEFDEDPEHHVVLKDIQMMGHDAFTSSLRSTLASSSERSLMVYVHGFNNSFEEAARRTAQIAYDLNTEGVDLVPALFSWPSGSSVSPSQYTYAWTNKDWAKGDLLEFLLTIKKAENADRIFLVAHSLGTNLLSSALEKLQVNVCRKPASLFTEIILAAPDIDAGTFKKVLAPALSRVAKRTTIYAANQDWALQISKEMHGGFPRLGDSSQEVHVVDDIDMVDVSQINVSDIGHGYYSEIRDVIRDIGGIFAGVPVAGRGLISFGDEGEPGRYWGFRRNAE